MAEFQLTLTAEEREFLVELLETTLKDVRVEEHRTRTPSYREHVLHREELIAALLNKLGEAVRLNLIRAIHSKNALMIALKHILLATDFSETSAVALRYARALAEQFQASLEVLHVLEDPLVGYVSECPTPTFVELRRNMEADAREHLDKLFTEAERARLHVQLLAKWGSPFVEIVRIAKESGVDLIVIGTHGRGPLKHMLLGSVAEKVVRHAPCPVLTVRHPEHEFVMP